MKNITIISIILIAINTLYAEEIAYNEVIKKVDIIGILPIKIGTIVEIECRVGGENDDKNFWFGGQDFLVVNKVNNKAVNNIIIPVKNGNPHATTKFTFNAGDTLKLIGYETLEVHGKPNDPNGLFEFPKTYTNTIRYFSYFIPLKEK